MTVVYLSNDKRGKGFVDFGEVEIGVAGASDGA